MYARVPGGQKAFINKDGSVGFTKEYKADEIPEGTIVEGWLYTPNAQNPSRLDGEVSFTGSPGGGGGKGWFACEMEEKGVWSVKIDVEGVDVSGCKSFKAVASVWTDEEAWAYN